MARSIKLTEQQWEKIQKDLIVQYPASYTLISWVTKRELGFTVRHHTEWGNGMVNSNVVVYLDFYDDHLETIFRLKHL